MENRHVYGVIFHICYIFSFEMESSLEPICHTKRHDKYNFNHPLTLLKHQIGMTKWVLMLPLDVPIKMLANCLTVTNKHQEEPAMFKQS